MVSASARSNRMRKAAAAGAAGKAEPAGAAVSAAPADVGVDRSRPVSMASAAYDLLKTRIINNHLAAGAEIDDEAVAAELGISRTPVREALLRLQSDGFVEIVPRRAVRVVPISLEDMEEMYDLLTALEVYAVELLAARRPGEAEVAMLRAAITDMRRALRADDRTAWINADERFHRGLLTLCGNRQIAEVGVSFRDRVLRAHIVALRLRPQPSGSVTVHNELIDLIVAGRVEEARANHLNQRVQAGREVIASVAKAGIRML